MFDARIRNSLAMPPLFEFNKAEREAYILERGCFSPEQNRAIYEKWFRKGPRYLFNEINKRYGLTRMSICDAGCSYGMNLICCTPESYGVEILPECAEFAHSLGLTVYRRYVVTEDLSDLPKVDAVWCCAVVEHVDAPHVFLRKISTLLRTGGLIFLWVPTIPPWPWKLLKYIPFMWRHMVAHTHSDHVNAFTPSTIRFIGERAGFETLEVSAMYPWPLRFFNRSLYVLDGAMYIGRKKEGSAYFGNSTRKGKAEYFDA